MQFLHSSWINNVSFHELLLFWFPQYIKLCYHSVFYINFHNISKYFCLAYKLKKEICLENTSLILLVDTFPLALGYLIYQTAEHHNLVHANFFFLFFISASISSTESRNDFPSLAANSLEIIYILCSLIVNSMFISITPTLF